MRWADLIKISVAVWLVGCGRTSPPNVPPFDQLRNVTLGMTADELKQRRQLRHAGYVGYTEQLPGGRVLYHMSGWRLHEEDKAGGRLRAVEYQQMMAKDSIASVYRDRVRELQLLLGPSSCRSKAAVVWNLEGARIVASYQQDYVTTFFQSKRGDVSNVAKSACRRTLFDKLR